MCYAQVIDIAGEIRFIPVIRFMVVVNVRRERTKPYADR